MNKKYEKFNRYELKYFISRSEVRQILKYLSAFMSLDEFSAKCDDSHYNVNSLYFENHDYYCYRQKFDGLPERRKFRIRFYDDNPSYIYLEVKKKRNFFTHKDRIKLDSGNGYFEKLICDTEFLSKYTIDDMKKKSEFFYFLHLLHLKPFLWVAYKRLALKGKFNKEIRITFDRNLSGAKYHRNIFNRKRLVPIDISSYSSKIIMEIKFRKIMPHWLENFIKEMNISHTSISKYSSVFDNCIGQI